MKSLVTLRLPVPFNEPPPEIVKLAIDRLLMPAVTVAPVMPSVPVPVTASGVLIVALPRFRLSEPFWISTSPLLLRLK